MARPRYVPVVGPRLKWLLSLVFALFALLSVNSAYLAAVTLFQWRTGVFYENAFYLWMFLLHLVLGLALILPIVIFGAVHIANARNRPNKRAIRAGYATFSAALGVLVTGLALTRVDIGGVTIHLRNPQWRDGVYWAHVALPVAAAWLFVLHRLAGRRIKWRIGASWAGVAALFAGGMLLLHGMNPQTSRPAPVSGARYYEPSLSRTDTGNFIPAPILNDSDRCLACHPDVHSEWAHSVHAISSFNNPLYAFSVRETRRHAAEHGRGVQDARFCAGCHDPVPFFSGAFELPKWDDPNYDVANDPLGKASITCTVCHSITAINGVHGNGDYTISEPPRYPFEASSNPFLSWVGDQLIKAKPAFHRRTFLKPEVQRSAEFCSVCHKVFLPEAINDYKWLRGQDHYDSWRLSGVSGRGVVSWYYPPAPQENCNSCHMKPIRSDDFGAKLREGELTVRDHMFPSANTAIPVVTKMPDAARVIAAHEAFNKDVMRVDLFALREGGTIEGALSAPLRPNIPSLRPGAAYLLDVVTRTVKMGHEFTQGTADSNEVWLDITAESNGVVIGRLGALDEHGRVDPWSKFFNMFLLDREGNRIERRNPQDIFIPLYNNQIPPGSADVTHLAFKVPEGAQGAIRVKATLRYRKFDLTFMRAVFGAETNDELPIMNLASDEISFPIAAASESGPAPQTVEAPKVPAWERWHDYGIGLFRTSERPGGKGELLQADAVFREVERLGRAEGSLGMARVSLQEGRVPDAVSALQRAAAANPPAYPWSVAWFSALANRQNGELEAAIANLREVIGSKFPLAVERHFDFGLDDRVLAELADTLTERARQLRNTAGGAASPGGAAGAPNTATSAPNAAATALLEEARGLCRRALAMDPERAATWYILSRVEQDLGDAEGANRALEQHGRYRVDDNARDRAVTAARIKYPAANHAAEAVVIYDLQRSGAFGLAPQAASVASAAAARPTSRASPASAPAQAPAPAP